MRTEREETERVSLQKADGRCHRITRKMAIIRDLSAACPHCGVDCTGSYLIWFVQNEIRKTIIVDRYRLDMLLQSALKIEDERILNCGTLPSFIVECNEARGWAAFESIDGEVLDRKAFREALAYVESCAPGDRELLDLLKEFLQYCDDHDLAAKIDER